MPAEPTPEGEPGGDPGPPGPARLLIRKRLPGDLAEAVEGDLVEEYRRRVHPARGRLLADLWFWWQALTLRAGALRRAHRRLRAARPRWERNRPRRAHDDGNVWRGIPLHPNDLKYALRRLVRSPGLTLVAVVSLALGIGANTAMFSLVNAALIRDLPVEDPDRVVEVYTSSTDGDPYSTSSYPDYRDLREGVDVFTGVGGSRTSITRLDRGGERSIVTTEMVSWDYFRTLGVSMALGRPFLEDEARGSGARPVAILGHRTWQREFGGDRNVLGRTIRLDGRGYTVVGVAPEAFTGSLPVVVTGVYLPLAMMDAVGALEGQLDRRGSRALFLKARLAPGVTVDQADQALAAFSSRLAERYPETNRDRTMSALPADQVSIHPAMDGILQGVGVLLLVVVGLVLVIACANLASFLLARAEDRRKEIAVRLAMGASRGALVRQLLLESTLLAALGGVGGALLADWTLRLLMSVQPPLPIPLDFDVSPDATVLLFTAAVSLVAGLAFGLVPALQATDPDVAPTLKDEGRSRRSGKGLSMRGGLVVAQVAFSFVLLIGAGLFVGSFQKAQAIDPGFETGPAAVVRPAPEIAGYEPEESRAFFDLFRERLRADPAIRRVALTTRLPLGLEFMSRHYDLPGLEGPAPDGHHAIDPAAVSPSYFEVLGVPIVQGRAFREGDPLSTVVVSRAFVSRYYPGERVVGRSISVGDGDEQLRIVGVAEDTRVRTLGEDPRPYVYHRLGPDDYGAAIAVATGPASGSELLGKVRGVLDELDPEMVVMEEKTMAEHASLALLPARIGALLLAVAGGLALLLAAIGIYGVVSHAVAKRTREMGIRMSLGASAADVVAMAVRGGMRLVLIGGVAGVVLAGALTWALKGFLYGIGTRDLATFVAIPAILLAVALVAALVPARRAAGVDPSRALRSE